MHLDLYPLGQSRLGWTKCVLGPIGPVPVNLLTVVLLQVFCLLTWSCAARSPAPVNLLTVVLLQVFCLLTWPCAARSPAPVNSCVVVGVMFADVALCGKKARSC